MNILESLTLKQTGYILEYQKEYFTECKLV